MCRFYTTPARRYAAPPSADEVARVLAGTARRIARLLASRADGDDDLLARDEPLLATLAAASLRTRIATGPHAGVAVPAHDRRRLARLCHYVARPPLASDRLVEQPDGRLALRLKTRWRDGTTHILMERHELLERLVPLIPPPRAYQVRYHGVLASCASTRDRVVPGPRQPLGPAPGEYETKEPGAAPIPTSAGATPAGPQRPMRAKPSAPARPPSDLGPGATDPSARGSSEASPPREDSVDPTATRRTPRRLPWAELLQRVFATDGLRCECGARMRLVAAIEDPDVARKILECLDLPARAPPLALADPEGSPWNNSEFGDEEPPFAVDPAHPEGWA